MIYREAEDMARLIFDFYVGEYAFNAPSCGHKIGDQCYSMYDFLDDNKRFKLDQYWESAVITVYNRMHMALGLSIASELRHFSIDKECAKCGCMHCFMDEEDECCDNTDEDDWCDNTDEDDWWRTCPNCVKAMNLKKQIQPFLKKFAKSYQDRIKGIGDISEAGLSHMNTSFSRLLAYVIAQKLGLRSTINLAKKVFDETLFDWNDGYGGELWQKGCEAWLKLDSANTISEKIIRLDTIFSMIHNNGCIFDKYEDTGINDCYVVNPLINDFVKDTKYISSIDGPNWWIVHVLDLKYRAKTPWEIWPYCSSGMRRVSAHVLHLKGYEIPTDIHKMRHYFFNIKDM